MKLGLSEKNRLTLPKKIIPEGVDRFDCDVDDLGRIILTPLMEIPITQRYFWTKKWQQGEREANEEARAGRVKQYADVEDLIKEIEKRRGKK